MKTTLFLSFFLSVLFISCSTSKVNKPPKDFTKNIENTLKHKNWKAFIPYCNQENYLAQTDMDITDKQYIFEILHIDLGYDEPNKTYHEQINDFLDSIVNVELRQDSNNKFLYKGYIYTSGEDILEFYITLDQNFKIIGALG